jgi:putative flippase GtrA
VTNPGPAAPASAAPAEPVANSSARSPFIRFVITGGISAVVNIAVRWLLGFVMEYQVAIIVAYLVAMTLAFFLARIFVFEPTPHGPAAQYLRFAIVNVVALAQVWLVSVGLAEYVFPAMGFNWQVETVAHAIGVASPVVTSYFGHRHFSFRN